MPIKNSLAFALPGAALVVAAGAVLLLGADASVPAQLWHSYTYVALFAGLILAWRLNSPRMLIATVALAALYALLLPNLLGSNVLARALFATFAPVGIALLAVRPDREFTAGRLAAFSALAGAPLLLAAFLSAGRTARALELLTAPWTILIPLSALALALVMALRAQRPGEAGIAWLTLAVVFMVAVPVESMAHVLWALAGALIIVVTLVEMAYVMAFHDELTGLPARRALKQTLAALQAPYAIAVVDVDHFKSFNDQHGHDVGDQVLRMVAARLREAESGVAFRTGGEEFTMVFADTGKREALAQVDAVREAIASANFSLRTLPRPRGKDANAKRGHGKAAGQLRVTVSVGVAAAAGRSERVEDVIRAADKAMYRAKNEGRNRVVA